MKSGLLVLKTLGEFPCLAVQVTTPVRKMNEHIHRDYDVEMLWELDEDNGEDSENRCKEVKCPTLSLLQQEGHIKKLVSDYDYQAALEIAKMLPESATKNYIELLTMASRRLLLDFGGVDKILSHNTQYVLPIKDSSVRKYFEYALSLNIKLQRAEYADFIRSITPVLVDLYELVLKKQCGININDYCETKRRGRDYIRVWSKNKLDNTTVQQELDNAFGGDFKGREIYSVHLMYLVDAFSDNLKIKNLASDLRTVEERIRNDAAHDIISVTEESIEKKTGFKPQKIMQMIRELFGFTGIHVKKEYWDSYDEMNNQLINIINAEE